MLEQRKLPRYFLYFIYKAYLNLQIQFRQTKFGFLWDPLSLIIVTFSISMLWSIVLEEKRFIDFFAYILSGYAIWMLISSLVDSSSGVFLNNRQSILNEYRPLLFYSLDNIIMHSMRFILIIPLVIFLLALSGKFYIFANSIYFIISFLFIIVFGVGVSLILGTLALFYKDVKFLMSSIMRLAFLLTPIIWKVDRLGEYKNYVFLNPFYPFLELSRSSMINETPDKFLILIVLIESIVICLIGIFLVNKFENKIRIRAFKL